MWSKQTDFGPFYRRVSAEGAEGKATAARAARRWRGNVAGELAII